MGYERYFENIQRKFNYDKEIMDVVCPAFRALVNYYCNYDQYFNKIYNLFMNTQIIAYDIHMNNETGNDFTEKENLMRLYSDKTEEEINCHVVYEGGELLHKVINNQVINTVIVKRINGKIELETVIHELIHGLVTSPTVIYKNGESYIRSGISKRVLTPVDYVTNHSIEEGFTEYDTMMACYSIGHMVEPSPKYYYLYDYAKTIMDDGYINKLITKTRLDGVNYLKEIKDENYKDILFSYINNFENVSRYKYNNYNEMTRLIDLSKENVKKILKIKKDNLDYLFLFYFFFI